jgi:hypothetical protein
MPARSRNQPWHSVSLLGRGRACAQILALRDRRFLSVEAPPLPLAECTNAPDCTCVYRHHRDRRDGPRRSTETTGVRSATPSRERRAGRGRRKDD